MTSLLNSIKQVLNEEKQNLEEKDENRKNINAKFSPSEHEAVRKALDAAVDHWNGKGTPDYMTSLKKMAKRDKNWTFNTDEVQFMYDAIADLPQHAKTAAMLKRKLSMAESVELEEAIKSKNQYGGYRNEVGSDAEYAKTHAMLKKLLGKDDTTIRDYMDSTSGRHLAGLEGDTAYIKKDFKKFMKKYDPSFFKEALNRKLSGQNEEIKEIKDVVQEMNEANDETYTWSTINKACIKLGMSPRQIANLLSALKKVNEAVEVDARKKSFREALKRIEGYKAKRSMKAEGKEEYEKFFKSAMKKFGITDLGDLEGKKEKEFYDYVDANWKAKDESVIEKVRKIVNEKRKQRTKAMNEVDEPSCQKDKDLVDFHKRNTQVKSDT